MTNYDEEMLFEENEFEFESVKIDSKAPSFNLPFYDPKKDNDGNGQFCFSILQTLLLCVLLN